MPVAFFKNKPLGSVRNRHNVVIIPLSFLKVLFFFPSAPFILGLLNNLFSASFFLFPPAGRFLICYPRKVQPAILFLILPAPPEQNLTRPALVFPKHEGRFLVFALIPLWKFLLFRRTPTYRYLF